MAAVPTLKPQLASATWVGGRRWDLNFQSGETLALPEGEDSAQRGADEVRAARQIVRPARARDRPLRPARSGQDDRPSPAGAGRADHPQCRNRSRDKHQQVAAPAEQQLIAVLDIGSSKVSAMIARPDDDGRLTVLGTGQRESRGVKRGYITDMAASEFAVREAVELAERMSGVTVEEVWASYGAGGLVSDVANVEVELGGHPVEQADIDELMQRRQGRDRQATGRSSFTRIRRSTRSTARKACSSRSASTPTASASTSTSSPPSRRRCATSIR